jgi:hypothetical protein
MVATIGATKERIEIVMGSAKVDYKDLTVQEQFEILKSFVGMCDLKHMRKFTGIRPMLVYDREYGLKRTADVDKVKSGYGRIPLSTHFLELGSQFDAPHKKDDFRHDKVPDAEYPAILRTEYDDHLQKTLVVDRDGAFYVLDVTWRLVEIWEERGMREYARYSASAQTITLTPLDDDGLKTVLACSFDLMLKSLGRIRLAQNETNLEIESQLRYGQRVMQKMHGVLRRLGSF